MRSRGRKRIIPESLAAAWTVEGSSLRYLGAVSHARATGLSVRPLAPPPGEGASGSSVRSLARSLARSPPSERASEQVRPSARSLARSLPPERASGRTGPSVRSLPPERANRSVLSCLLVPLHSGTWIRDCFYGIQDQVHNLPMVC